jgi:hypothetical protein
VASGIDVDHEVVDLTQLDVVLASD